MDYLNYIYEKFPIRRSKEQKEVFQEYIINESSKLGKTVCVETNDKNQNIVIGNVQTAKVIFTAHYDTPATSLVPNLMLPRNPLICYLYHIGYPVALAMLSLLITKGIQALFSLDYKAWAVLYIILYFGIYFLCSRAFTNKHNKNDNTSGVAAVLGIIEKHSDDDIAFILFDNEEKGLLGSKAYSKAHKDDMAQKLIINLDCVGVGSDFLTIANPDAEKSDMYSVLKASLVGNSEYNVTHCPKRGSMANSDHKNFNCGVGIMSCRNSKLFGYYTSKIHTNKDTEALSQNIEFISNALTDFASKI